MGGIVEIKCFCDLFESEGLLRSSGVVRPSLRSSLLRSSLLRTSLLRADGLHRICLVTKHSWVQSTVEVEFLARFKHFCVDRH